VDNGDPDPIWPHFSMWHTLFEGGNINFFSGSHRVPSGGTVHRCSKITLEFPSDIPLLLLFHGRTVHCGAQSRVIANTFQCYHDLRCFSYVKKENETGKNDRQSRERIGTRSIGTKTYSQTTSNKIETHNFNMCTDDKELLQKCQVCHNLTTSNMYWDGSKHAIKVDVKQEYNHAKTLKRNEEDKFRPLLVCGDMNKFGWAIYEGVNINKDDYYEVLQKECWTVLYESSFVKLWKGLQMNSKGKKFRMSLNLDDQDISDKMKMKNQISTLLRLFSNIELDVLRNIKDFEYATITKKVLLANFGQIEEQQEHRDYAK
jgi:hypothetical protein